MASVIFPKACFGTPGCWGKIFLSRVFLQVYLKVRLVQIFGIRHSHSWVNSDGSCYLSGRIKRNYVTFSYSELYKHQTTGSFVRVVQFSSVIQSCPTLQYHEPQHARPPCPTPTPKVYPNSCPLSWWCHPTISSSVIPISYWPQSFPASGSFQESTLCIRRPKYWSFSFNISSYNEHPGLISFKMGWLDPFAVQGTHKSLLQHHSSKTLILLCSAFFTVQLSHPYITTGKTIALTSRTFVGTVMSLLFNKSSHGDTQIKQ